MKIVCVTLLLMDFQNFGTKLFKRLDIKNKKAQELLFHWFWGVSDCKSHNYDFFPIFTIFW